MDKGQVVELMESSKSAIEWRTNCDAVKKAHEGHYPDFWYEAILASGLMARVTAKWGGTDKMTVTSL